LRSGSWADGNRSAGSAAPWNSTHPGLSDLPVPGHPGAPGRPPLGRAAGHRRLAAAGLLLAEWPPQAAKPTDYWLADTPLPELVRLAKIRWRIERDYRELKTGLGLDHFEGRTFAGWHRHVTLVTAAQLFLTLLRHDPKAALPA
jgi:hypothetical protein